MDRYPRTKERADLKDALADFEQQLEARTGYWKPSPALEPLPHDFKLHSPTTSSQR